MFTLMVLIMVHGIAAEIHVNKGDYLAWVDKAITSKILGLIGLDF